MAGSDSWWDVITGWLGDTGSAVGNAIGDAGGAVGTALSGIGNYAVDKASSMPGDAMDNLMGLTNGYGTGSGTGLAGVASSMPGNAMDNLMSVTNGYGTGAGLASSGGTSLLSSAGDWAKKNPAMIETGLKLFGTSQQKNAPAAATTAGYNAAVKGNEARSAVGQSMINQAPFLANNAEAAAKGAGANAAASEAQRLQQNGYKPGDAVYDSAMQTRSIGNQQNEATAYGSGQAQSASQMNTGAGLMTPNLTGYGALGNEQNAQQTNQNKQNENYGALAKNAFDIWANPDKANKQAADGTGAYAKP